MSRWARSASHRRGCRSRTCAARARTPPPTRVRNWPRRAPRATIDRVRPLTRRLLTSTLWLVLAVAPVAARSEKTLAYPRDQVWPTAVRFLVVDERVKVLEKDADAG